MARLLSLPPIDTSLGIDASLGFIEPPSASTTAAPTPKSALETIARNSSIPRSSASTDARRSQVQSRLLDTASVVVATALSADPTDQQPLPARRIGLSTRTDSTYSQHSLIDNTNGAPPVPQIPDRFGPLAYHPTPEQIALTGSDPAHINERLTAVVADVLGVETSDVHETDSIIELGGDLQTAAELRLSCLNAGLSIDTSDILRCSTVADLQSVVTPLSAAQIQERSPGTSFLVSPLQLSSTSAKAQRVLGSSVPATLPQSRLVETQAANPARPQAHRRTNSNNQVRKRASRKFHNQVEHVLSLNGEVSRAALMKPKVGLFEGQQVAFLTLSSCVFDGPDDCQVKILNANYAHQLPGIRRDVEAKVAPTLVPKIWIVLERMPLDESSNPDRRKLQTWVQNVNEDMYQHILSVDVDEQPTQPMTDNERMIQCAASRVLMVEQSSVGMNVPFIRLGGDARSAKQLASRCRSLGLLIGVDDILKSASLAYLASLATPHDAKAESDAIESSSFGLAPMQRLYLSTPMGKKCCDPRSDPQDYRFNQSVLFRFRKTISVDSIRAALESIVQHHSMLRCRFHRVAGSWRQSVESDVSGSFHFGDHAISTENEVEKAIQDAQMAIDAEFGPVFAAHHFRTHDGYQMLYLIAHHLVVDLKSWDIITRDLDALLTRGCLFSNPKITCQEWVQQQERFAQNNAQLARKAPFEIPPADWGYWGISDKSNLYGRTATTGFTIGKDIIAMLGDNAAAIRKDCTEIFIAAIALSFAQTFRDRNVPIIWNQEHERTSVESHTDLSETVGWFTSLCPLRADVTPQDDLSSVLCRIKDARQQMSAMEPPYFVANLVDDNCAGMLLAEHFPLEVLFTFAGAIDDETKSQELLLERLRVPGSNISSRTSDIGSEVGRISAFEISACVHDGEVKFKFVYHEDTYHQDLVRAWIRGCQNILVEGIKRRQLRFVDLALTDIPHLDADYEGLRLLNKTILPGLNINPKDIETIFPATTIQEHILVNQSLVPGSSDCSMVFDFDVEDDPINIGRICAAWQQVSDKYSTLRAVFAPSVSRTGLFDVIILRRHSPSMLFLETDHDQDALRATGDHPPLALTEGVPWHRLVVCQAPSRVLIKIEANQALCDGASLAILCEELEQAYLGQCITTAPCITQWDYLQMVAAVQSSTDFWRERMSGINSSIFPHLASRKSSWSNPIVSLPIRRERLEEFAQTYRIKVATIFQAAWGMLLRTYIGSDDVCFGYRTDGRSLDSSVLQDAVGCFSRMLICRLAVPDEQIIAQVLLDAETSTDEALQHQIVDIADIQHSLGIKGRELFNTCISFGYEDVSRPYLLDSDMTFIASQRSSHLDVDVNIHFIEGTLAVDMGNRILSSDQAIHVAHVFGRAVQTLLDFPDSSIQEADLFTELDHQQILSWNSTSKFDLATELIHQMIARKATENADIQAVSAWDGDFTYHELNQYSKGLASHLVLSGLKPHTPVVVIMEKNRWSIVAMLAVLYSGAILVPVDAEAKSIIKYVLMVMGPRFILASDNVRGSIECPGAEVILINEYTVPTMSTQTTTLNQSQTESHHAACILFEHGCAKTRKCISYSHGALATACQGQGPALRINPSSRVMQLSSFSVDIALSEIFTTLVHGGCVCVPSAAERIADFTGAARRMNVNWTYLTPTLSRKLTPESVPDLAVVCFRTRQLDDDTYALWAGKAKVLLVYGSAGTCPLGLSAAEVNGTNDAQCIGNPFCGNFWIVSAEDTNRLVPVGAVGQLVIGSPTLGSEIDLGNQDISTWTANIANQHGSDVYKPDMQLLHTGQPVRYGDQGQIELIARDFEAADTAGNIFRFSDIEPKLRRCLGRGVDVVVEAIGFQDPVSRPVLVAFVELGDNLFHGKEDLLNLSPVTKERLFLAKRMAEMVLRETLPGHMIPSAYVPVKQMPLTPSLKVNRLKLQKMILGLTRQQIIELSEVPNPQEVEAIGLKPLPFTNTEQHVRTIWSSILDVPEASITANNGFMSLGGDAVLAHNLIVRCRQHGITLSIVDVLRNLTLAELCRGVSTDELVTYAIGPARQGGTSSEDGLVEITDVAQTLGLNRTKIQDVAEASSLQSLSVEAGSLATRGNVNYFMLSIAGALDWIKLESACCRLIKAHPILRTSFKIHDRKLYQIVSRSHRADFERHQCPNWRLGNLATKIMKKDQSLVADFSKPLTKFFFVDAGRNSILVLRLSRAQYDEASIPFLLRDLSLLYDRGDRDLRRPGFCDIVRASQATYSTGAIDYWRTLLDGASMTQVVSQTGPTVPSATSKTILHRMPTGSLQNLGIPFETILKGSWSVVLSNLSCSDDVVFGHLVEGKHLALPDGRTDVVGPRGNIIPVRTRLPDIGITPYEFFRCIQSQHIASVPHENMQFMDIIQRCTDWAPWTRFSTVVQHQRESDREVGPEKTTIGDAACKLDSLECNHQNTDMFVRSSIFSATEVEISLTFDEKRIPAFFADDVLKSLCTTITLLTSAFVTEPLSFKGLNNYNTTSPKIPLHIPRQEDAKQPGPVRSVMPEHARAINTLISDAWDAILEAHSHRVADIRVVPFYKIWGSLIPAAELARFYTAQVADLRIPGLEQATFSMEDIVDSPTMMQQYELIVSRQVALSHLRRNTSLTLGTRAGSWGSHIRRLAPERKGLLHYSSTGRNGPPVIAHLGVGGGGSMESMTTGSSHSDSDELRDGGIGYISSTTSPSQPSSVTNSRKPLGSKHSRKTSLTLGKLKIPNL